MRILWHLRPRYDTDTNGANFRYFHFTNEMVARGHHVYFLLDYYSSGDDAFREQFIESLRTKASLSGCDVLDAPHRSMREKLAQKLVHPGLVDRILRNQRSASSQQIVDLIERYGIDTYISSVRGQPWLLSSLQPKVTTVMDWCDSLTLACLRDLHRHLPPSSPRAMVRVLVQLLRSAVWEAYYPRRANLNIVVSPVDKSVIDRLSGVSEKNHVIYNGVTFRYGAPVAKVPKRIIFSGRMDFAPNYQSALWFIKEVMPLVVAGAPDAELVIAGADPIPELVAQGSRNVHVLGYVPDISAAIAASALSVAPMISGSGFKNKVVEAIANGTMVAGTSMAFEFLDADLRQQLLVGDTPQELASQILTALQNPPFLEDRLQAARQLVFAKFNWAAQTDQLLELLRTGSAQRSRETCSALQTQTS